MRFRSACSIRWRRARPTLERLEQRRLAVLADDDAIFSLRLTIPLKPLIDLAAGEIFVTIRETDRETVVRRAIESLDVGALDVGAGEVVGLQVLDFLALRTAPGWSASAAEIRAMKLFSWAISVPAACCPPRTRETICVFASTMSS